MKFLIDNALSPLVANGLKSAGYDTVHVRDYGMQNASDAEILERALNENCVIIEGFCNSCSRVTGYKREIGIGTLFAVFLTLGFWLLLIPLYPKRCKICGNQKTIYRTEEDIKRRDKKWGIKL